ncbi:universal stress protein [Methanothermobacter tenebrarum]|uniref:Universal stress protein n=1 Tax=Methanothermobacter tenebrarum TaxID=680118 RepID=A0A328PHY3_9EURY|nr:universal stress protein [Methanothermobacter tenebrarum]NPV64711.1 universal stress protein [Methanobacteriaceae archaeon]RAO79044.1 universal stress protein [Methanothermobacter tenebrarum]
MFKRIMVPTDGSEQAQKAEDIAIELAEKLGARVVAVHIMDEKLIYPFEVLEEEGKSILAKVQEKGKKRGVQIDEILIYGNPIHDMKKIAERSKADLIIMGHGKSGFEKFLMGSVAESTLKNVKIPVLIVK